MRKNVYLMAAVSLLAACQHNHPKAIPDEKSTAVKVTVKTVMQVMDNNELRYSGTIEPSQTVALMFKTPGTVENVYVNEGDIVKKGQALATINKTTAQNLYDVSLASYQQAKDAYDRLKTVYEKGSLTEMKWVDMETKLKQAESQMRMTRSNLDDCTLRSPDNGMIGHRNVEPGQTSLGITAPLELVKIDKVLVKVSVPENEISKIRKGMKASFSISALDDESFTGTVNKVGIMADRFSRTYDVNILADNQEYKIKPGMVCDVRLQLSAERSISVVPARSVSMDDSGRSFVWRVNVPARTVSKVKVKPGRYNQAGIEVSSGLNANDVVVVEGKEKLSENISIQF
jgi:RND family efflux transporter MFP subunit